MSLLLIHCDYSLLFCDMIIPETQFLWTNSGDLMSEYSRGFPTSRIGSFGLSNSATSNLSGYCGRKRNRRGSSNLEMDLAISEPNLKKLHINEVYDVGNSQPMCGRKRNSSDRDFVEFGEVKRRSIETEYEVSESTKHGDDEKTLLPIIPHKSISRCLSDYCTGVLSLDGKILDCNTRFGELAGYPKEMLKDKALLNMIEFSEREKILDNLKLLFNRTDSESSSVMFQTSLINSNSNSIPVQVCVRPIYGTGKEEDQIKALLWVASKSPATMTLSHEVPLLCDFPYSDPDSIMEEDF